MTAPDYSCPFVGWKGLLADGDGRLYSPAIHTEWPAGEALTAKCNLGKAHTPPHPKCSCGVYAVDTFESLRQHGYSWQEARQPGQRWVIVEVNLWGNVRKGQIGLRTHLAYPKTVYVPAYLYAIGNAVRLRYGIPLRFIDRFTGERS
jgi:hypothetical protein